MSQELLTANQLAEALGLHVKTVLRLAKAEDWPRFTFGRGYRFDLNEILEARRRGRDCQTFKPVVCDLEFNHERQDDAKSTAFTGILSLHRPFKPAIGAFSVRTKLEKILLTKVNQFGYDKHGANGKMEAIKQGLGLEAIKQIAKQTDTVMLSFSCGKDSIATWLSIKPFFRRIIPVYLYVVPGVEFVERSLRYYEDVFEAHIIRAPQPWLYRALREYVYQPPQHCPVLETARLPKFNRDKLFALIAEDCGLTQPAWTAVGILARDSINRRFAIAKSGAINKKRKTFYPICDWKKSQVVNIIRGSELKLPVDYRLFGRPFDGISYEYLAQIQKHFPDDYQRILEFFPLADMDIFRHKVGKYGIV